MGRPTAAETDQLNARVMLAAREAFLQDGFKRASMDRICEIARTTIENLSSFEDEGAPGEDPVTGSLNAGLALWLLRTGRATAPYVVSQGTLLGRAGRVHGR